METCPLEGLVRSGALPQSAPLARSARTVETCYENLSRHDLLATFAGKYVKYSVDRKNF